MIKVIAKKKGFYGSIQRDPGDVFYISKESDFSNNWMKHAPDQSPEATKHIIEFAKRLVSGFSNLR